MAEFHEAQPAYPAFFDDAFSNKNQQAKFLSENKINFIRGSGNSPSIAYQAIIYKDICVTGKKLSIWKKALYSLKSLTSWKISKPIDQKEDSLKGIGKIPKDKKCSNETLKAKNDSIDSSACHLSKKYLIMHFNTHNLYYKGSNSNLLCNVRHFSQDRIPSDTCRTQSYEVQCLKYMRLPVVDFPEGNTINAQTSINTCSRHKLCKKNKNVSKIDKLDVHRSCNAVLMKSNCMQVQAQLENKYTEPYRSLGMKNTKNIQTNVISANHQGIKISQDFNCVYKNKYFQEPNNKKDLPTGNCKINYPYFYKHKIDYSQNSNKKHDEESSKACFGLNNERNCRTRNKKQILLKSIEPVCKKDFSYKNIKCKENIQPKNKISHQSKKCMVTLNKKHNSCQCPLKKKLDCYENKYNGKYHNGDVNRFKKIKEVSRSDQILSLKENKCLTKTETTETCKVVNSDINTSYKHDHNILYNFKHKRNIRCDKNHTDMYRCPRNLRYLNVQHQCGDGYIQHFIKSDKNSLSHPHQNQIKKEKITEKYFQDSSSIIKIALKGRRRVMVDVATLPIQYHTSCPGKSCIEIPLRLCKCRTRLCNQIPNNTIPILPQKKRKRHSKEAHKHCRNVNPMPRENLVCKDNKKTYINNYLKCIYCKGKNIYKLACKCRKENCKSNRKVDFDYNCSELFQYTLRRKPFFFIYRICPWAYPECLNFCCMWKQCTEMMCIICTCLIWCPFFLMLEICRLGFCYFCYE